MRVRTTLVNRLAAGVGAALAVSVLSACTGAASAEPGGAAGARVQQGALRVTPPPLQTSEPITPEWSVAASPQEGPFGEVDILWGDLRLARLTDGRYLAWDYTFEPGASGRTSAINGLRDVRLGASTAEVGLEITPATPRSPSASLEDCDVADVTALATPGAPGRFIALCRRPSGEGTDIKVFAAGDRTGALVATSPQALARISTGSDLHGTTGFLYLLSEAGADGRTTLARYLWRAR